MAVGFSSPTLRHVWGNRSGTVIIQKEERILLLLVSLNTEILQTLLVPPINSAYALGPCNAPVVPHIWTATVLVNAGAWQCVALLLSFLHPPNQSFLPKQLPSGSGHTWSVLGTILHPVERGWL